MQRSKESPLHQAVLQDDIEAVQRLSQDKLLLRARNTLGLTALEIAQFLDKKNALDLLQSQTVQAIKVVEKHEKHVTEYSRVEFEKAFGIHYVSHLKFSSYDSLKEVIRNCPWTLKSFWGEDNRELGIQYENELSEGYTVDFVIKWIDEIFGYGVFAATDIEAGAYIGEYTGLVRRLYRSHPDHNGYCFHYPTRLWSWKYLMVDALNEGNVLRFINHSDEPNLEPLCLVNREILHLVFRAKTTIKQGAQLTFNYGTDYWRRRHKR